MILNDSVVSIRPITLGDTENIIKWRNHPDVIKNFIFRTPLTEKMHRDWYENKVQTNQVVQFIIHDHAMDRDIGTVYLRDIDYTHQKAEFGILIGEKSARGKGYGTRAAQLILSFAFLELLLNKVMLRVFKQNIAAIKSYEKVGFHTEGVFCEDVILDGKPIDVVFMAVFKKDWDKNGKDG